MLPASVFARDNSVKTLNIVYEYPSKAQSLYLSEKGGEVLLGALNSKDDVALKIPISSTGGVVAGNLSVSTESDFITPVAEVSSLNISPGGTAEIPISVLIEKLPENGPEKVGFTVTFSYGKKSLSATFSLTLYPENTPVGNYTFPTSATSATSLVNTGKTVLITKNSALLFLNEANGKTVLAAENFGKFPKETAYTTGDGTWHILFYDGYIEADGGQYVFITSPSALPGKVIADFGTDAVTLRQTVAFDYANGSPPLAFSDPNAVIVIPSGSKVDFMLSDKENVHDGDWEKTSDGVDISYEIQKLESSVWTKNTDFVLSSSPNSFGDSPTEGKISAEAKKNVSRGTYRLYVTQKIGNITLSELYMPFFVTDR